MKRLQVIFLIIVLSYLFSGCITSSIYPLYTTKDLVFKAELIGTWDQVSIWDKDEREMLKKEGDDPNPHNPVTISFEGMDNKYYKLTVIEKNIPYLFEAYLVKIKDNLYFDTYPVESNNNLEGPNVFHYAPVHVISKVKINGDFIEVCFMESFDLNVEKRDFRLKIVGDVIASSTEELQVLVDNYFRKGYRGTLLKLQRRK